MISQDFIRQLSGRAAELFPGAGEAHQQAEQQLQGLLQSTFQRLNLVTREEFDAQTALLERAEETIARLEGRIEELEAQASPREDAQEGKSS